MSEKQTNKQTNKAKLYFHSPSRIRFRGKSFSLFYEKRPPENRAKDDRNWSLLSVFSTRKQWSHISVTMATARRY